MGVWCWRVSESFMGWTPPVEGVDKSLACPSLIVVIFLRKVPVLFRLPSLFAELWELGVTILTWRITEIINESFIMQCCLYHCLLLVTSFMTSSCDERCTVDNAARWLAVACSLQTRKWVVLFYVKPTRHDFFLHQNACSRLRAVSFQVEFGLSQH